MTRRMVGFALALVLFAGSLFAQQKPERGKIKKVDAGKGILTLTIGSEDRDFHVTKATRVVDESGKDVADRLEDKRFKVGVAVMFLARERDGKHVLVGVKLGGGPGGGDIQKGRIKKLDLDKMRLTVTVDGKDRDLILTESTQVLGAAGETLRERLSSFKPGVAIFFKVGKKDGKELLIGLRLAGQGGNPRATPGDRIKVDTAKFKALSDLGSGKYRDYEGGFYPGGKNQRPAAHEKAGLRLAGEVVPRDADGKPSTEGKIALLSVGMSNTSQVSGGFADHLSREKGINPKLVFVNGAQGGMTAEAIQDPDDSGRGTRYWTTVDDRLKQAGLTRAQVQVIWIKEADAGPPEGFPGYARKLQGELRKIVQLLPGRFPNLKLVYLSSRTFGGYARIRLNPEPYAYESGFAVKWLIAEQIEGKDGLKFDAGRAAVKAPWLSWGPYLWANGTSKRADGFSYEESDFGADGTHLSASGVRKTGKLLLDFFKSDTTTKPWFLAAKGSDQ